MTIISTSTEKGFTFTASLQNLIVTEGTVLAGSDAVNSGQDANSNAYTGNGVYNYGTILGVGFAEGIRSTGGSIQFLFNEKGASINGGIYLQGNSYTNITNAGNVDAVDYGIQIDLDSKNAFIFNSGSITGLVSGVYLTSDNNVAFVNTGEISSTEDGVYLNDSIGAVSINNSGLIQGSGTDPQGWLGSGLGAIIDDGSETLILRNSGKIDGDIALGSGSDTIRNTGLINGNVFLSSGGTLFDSRKGTVTETITGGAGADTILAGGDGEVMAGGKGHDILYGGAGADTFAFLSASGSDTDVVHRFDVSQDTIQLAHSAFTHLVAGQAPTFAVGTAATSATDYLFYNSGSGVLYYDVDGSGSHAPYAVATFDKGLSLTASSFSVV